jgi:hypothetical protein
MQTFSLESYHVGAGLIIINYKPIKYVLLKVLNII